MFPAGFWRCSGSAPVVLAATAIDTLMHSPARDRILRAVGIAFGIWTGVALLLQVGNRPVPGAMVVAAVMTAGIVCLFAIVTTPPSDRYSRFVPRAQAGLAILLMLLVIGDPAGRRLVSTLETGQTMSEVIRIPTGPVSRQAVPENDATTDPGGAGEFLQEKRDAGEYFRYFGYDNVLQQGGESYPSTYRENFGNPTAIAILVNARAMRLHLNDVQGYNPVQLKNYVTYLNQLNDAVQNYHDAQILAGRPELATPEHPERAVHHYPERGGRTAPAGGYHAAAGVLPGSLPQRHRADTRESARHAACLDRPSRGAGPAGAGCGHDRDAGIRSG